MRQFIQDHNARSFVNRHKALLGFIACLAIIMGTVAYVAITSAQIHRALCALRADQQQQIASSQAFLKAHPDGIPEVSPKLIRDGISNRQRTVHALRSLHCG